MKALGLFNYEVVRNGLVGGVVGTTVAGSLVRLIGAGAILDEALNKLGGAISLSSAGASDSEFTSLELSSLAAATLAPKRDCA